MDIDDNRLPKIYMEFVAKMTNGGSRHGFYPQVGLLSDPEFVRKSIIRAYRDDMARCRNGVPITAYASAYKQTAWIAHTDDISKAENAPKELVQMIAGANGQLPMLHDEFYTKIKQL